MNEPIRLKGPNIIERLENSRLGGILYIIVSLFGCAVYAMGLYAFAGHLQEPYQSAAVFVYAIATGIIPMILGIMFFVGLLMVIDPKVRHG